MVYHPVNSAARERLLDLNFYTSLTRMFPIKFSFKSGKKRKKKTQDVLRPRETGHGSIGSI